VNPEKAAGEEKRKLLSGADRGKNIAFGILGGIVLVLIILGVWINGTYNSLVQLDQATQAQWAQGPELVSAASRSGA